MQAHLGRFRLGTNSSGSGSNLPSSALASTNTQFSFRAFPDPTPLLPPIGSLEYDLTQSKYNFRWDNWAQFQAWRTLEQEKHCIELRLVNTYEGMPVFVRQCRYVCSRAGTGGEKEYHKLHPDWSRKIANKRTDCKCCLLVKEYPGASTILGNYRDEHNHALGNANLPFTQISKETREYIAGLLRLKVAPEHIVSCTKYAFLNFNYPLFLASSYPSRCVRW
ncbi:hypothetical protein B0H13DRAFT_1622405 [Mycena leptocephala]|nr:hypothetical protein B0H13DRAFT_1622405 [Mycena leptocephala]